MLPGRYEYDDPLRDAPDDLKPFASHVLARIHLGRVTVDVTEVHLKLLKGANVRLRDDGGRSIFVGIDSKRPYGDMTNFYIDMGSILGIAPMGPSQTAWRFSSRTCLTTKQSSGGRRRGERTSSSSAVRVGPAWPVHSAA